jgi:hypothetical protein
MPHLLVIQIHFKTRSLLSFAHSLFRFKMLSRKSSANRFYELRTAQFFSKKASLKNQLLRRRGVCGSLVT